MVDVQDGDPHTHKRTAIPQLLNPVTSSPTKRQEEQGFPTHRGAFQRPGPSFAGRSNFTVQICLPQVQRPSTCVLQTGDEETPRLLALSITLLLQTPMAVSEAVAPVTQHTILDHALMTATAI